MSTALLTREYAALTDEWKAAEDARQRIVERFRALDGPLGLDMPAGMATTPPASGSAAIAAVNAAWSSVAPSPTAP